MAEPKSAAADPSMDDILASIRKIISEDEARAQVGRPVPPPAPPRPAEDVLLLTNPIEEPAAKVPVPPLRAERLRIDPARAAEMPQPAVEPPVESPGDEARSNAVSALARLNRAVQDSVPPAQADDPGPTVGSSGKTLEDLVKEALRPMLQEWLDRNLPQIVERHVEREIVRLTRR
ncbi:MAG: DUF2497 domain-containing protein [Pseudomonadota bacterium]